MKTERRKYNSKGTHQIFKRFYIEKNYCTPVIVKFRSSIPPKINSEITEQIGMLLKKEIMKACMDVSNEASIADAQAMVGVFHRVFKMPVGEKLFPKIKEEDVESTSEILRERLEDLTQAIEDQDIVLAAEGIAQLLYSVLGTAVAFGIELAPVFYAIHTSNMEKKLDLETGEIKIPNGWEKPNIKEEILKYSGEELEEETEFGVIRHTPSRGKHS